MSKATDRAAELRQQLAAAWEQYGDATSQRQAAEVEQARAKRGLDDMTKRRAQSRATDKEVLRAEQRAEQADAELQRQYARANQALDATKSLEHDLRQLMRDHPDEFAEQAEAETQRAAQVMRAAYDALGRAWDAWAAAERAWQPLAQAMGVEGVPPCPLPAPASVTERLPRPPQARVGV